MFDSPARTCRRARQWLHQRLDGSLAPADRAALEQHLARCARCAERSRTLDAALFLLRNAPRPEPSADLPARILAAAQAAQRSRTRVLPSWRPAPAWAAAGLAVAVMAVLTLAIRSLVAPVGPQVGPRVISEAPRPAETMAPQVATTPSSAAPVAARPPILAAGEVTERSSGRIEPAVWRVRGASSRQPRPERKRPAPVLAYASVPLTPAVMVADVSKVGSVVEPEAVGPRVARVDTSSPSGGRQGGSGDFAHEIVGGLVANVILSDYLEAAPEGTRLPPTGAGGSNGT